MRIQRTLGRFPSPTPCWFLVRMYLCGYVACSARAPAQHCWTTLRWPRNSRNVGTCWLWSLTSFKFHPTTSNKSQQHTTWCANARNMLGPTMLRAFARALRAILLEWNGSFLSHNKNYNIATRVSGLLESKPDTCVPPDLASKLRNFFFYLLPFHSFPTHNQHKGIVYPIMLTSQGCLLRHAVRKILALDWSET